MAAESSTPESPQDDETTIVGSREPAAQSPTDPGTGPTLRPGSGEAKDPTAGSRTAHPELHRIGEFEIVRELARGGMGVVYVARHPRLDRQVALKVMLATGQTRQDQLERFAIEARAAARLRHPNIVGIHTLGEDRGRPYIVMDLIDGESLKDRIKRAGPLDLREAARVTQRLAEALSYAHARAILHRDMKPANVLLSGDGEPMITDFGLAKDIRSPDNEGLTDTGQVMGTPGYMPPEQADGKLDQIDRRADIYSLGATLYEMLTGRAPFAGGSLINLLHAVLTKEPEPLRKLRPDVDRELETICLKCLQKEPEQRYPSAKALADDVGRYLRDEPIVARPPTRLERAGKWLRRNRVLARGMGLTVVVALVFVVALTVYYLIDLRQKEKAARDAARAAELAAAEAQRSATAAEGREMIVTGLLDGVNDMLDEMNQRPGTTFGEARQEILGMALETAERLRDTHMEEAPISTRAADAYHRIGNLAVTAGRWDHAGGAYQQSLEIRRRLVAQDRTNATARHDLAISLNRLGRLRHRQGDLVGALQAHEESLQICRGLASHDPTQATTLSALSASIKHVGDVRIEQGDFAGALRAHEESLEIDRALVSQDPTDAKALRALYCALERVGNARMAQGNHAEALVVYEESLEICRELVTRDPTYATAGRDLSRALCKVGDARRAQGQHAEALTLYEEALEFDRMLMSQDPTNADVRNDLTVSLASVSEALQALGDHAEALALYEECLESDRMFLSQDPTNADVRSDLTVSLDNVGEVRQAQGDLAGALRAHEEAIQIRREVVSRDPTDAKEHQYLSDSLFRVGEIRHAQGELAGALLAHEEALQIRREVASQDPKAWRAISVSISRVGEVREDQGDLTGALEAYIESLQLDRELVSQDPESATARQSLYIALEDAGRVRQAQGDLAGALQDMEESLQLSREIVSQDPTGAKARRDLAATLSRLGNVRMEKGDLSGAGVVWEESLEIARELVAQDPTDVTARRELSVALEKMGRVRYAQGDPVHALQHLEGCIEIRRELVALDSTDPTARRDLCVSLWNLGAMVQAEGDTSGALAHFRTAWENFQVLVEQAPQYQPEMDALRRDIRIAQLTGEGRNPGTSGEHLELAQALYARGDFARSVEHFAQALQDQAIRHSLEGWGNLYWGACSAARAAADAEGEAKEAHVDQALGWLSEDLQLRRQVLAQIAQLLADPDISSEQRADLEGQRAAQAEHLIEAHELDPDLDSLRALPAFLELFDR